MGLQLVTLRHHTHALKAPEITPRSLNEQYSRMMCSMNYSSLKAASKPLRAAGRRPPTGTLDVVLHEGRGTHIPPEYDIASLYMVSFYCFVTKACARRPGAAASVERRRREHRTLLAGVAGKLAELMHILCPPPP